MTPGNWKSNKHKTLQISENHVPSAASIIDDILPFALLFQANCFLAAGTAQTL
jgi:hypothetical protein